MRLSHATTGKSSRFLHLSVGIEASDVCQVLPDLSGAKHTERRVLANDADLHALVLNFLLL